MHTICTNHNYINHFRMDHLTSQHVYDSMLESAETAAVRTDWEHDPKYRSRKEELGADALGAREVRAVNKRR